jgi:hypothetical protein
VGERSFLQDAVDKAMDDLRRHLDDEMARGGNARFSRGGFVPPRREPWADGARLSYPDAIDAASREATVQS